MNGYGNSYEDLMLPRLEATSQEEGTKYVLEEMRHGRKLSDAVLDTIEALPQSKTRRIRAWSNQLDAFMEWERWNRQGWEIEMRGRGKLFTRAGERVTVIAPTEADIVKRDRSLIPPMNSIAAAVGASAVHYIGTRLEDHAVLFEVTRGI